MNFPLGLRDITKFSSNRNNKRKIPSQGNVHQPVSDSKSKSTEVLQQATSSKKQKTKDNSRVSENLDNVKGGKGRISEEDVASVTDPDIPEKSMDNTALGEDNFVAELRKVNPKHPSVCDRDNFNRSLRQIINIISYTMPHRFVGISQQSFEIFLVFMLLFNLLYIKNTMNSFFKP